jgi:RNA polymerase sigma-70 factor (sigma-E family)
VTFEQFAQARLRHWLVLVTALCGDGGLAEDVVQEVLIRVHARWDRIEPMAARDAYVRRMLVNELTSWRRKWARIIPVETVHTAPPVVPDHAVTLGLRDELAHEVRQLPERQRMVIVLRYYADMSDDQIADAMGCRASTVRAYAARALATLRIQAESSLSPAEEGRS